MAPRERVQQRSAKKSATTESDIVVSSDKARPPGIEKHSATTDSDSRNAVDTAVASLADEARPPGIEKQSATAGSDIAVSLGEAGPSRPRANGRNAVDAAVARLADEARPPGIEKQSATTGSDIAVKLGLLCESSGGAGPSWSKANDVDTAAATAAVKSAGEARPSGIAKHGAKKESELAVSRRRLLEELSEQWEREFGYRVQFSEKISYALN